MHCSSVTLQVCKALGTLLRAPMGLVAVMDLYIMYQQYACDMCMYVIRDGQGFCFSQRGNKINPVSTFPKKDKVIKLNNIEGNCVA